MRAPTLRSRTSYLPAALLLVCLALGVYYSHTVTTNRVAVLEEKNIKLQAQIDTLQSVLIAQQQDLKQQHDDEDGDSPSTTTNQDLIKLENKLMRRMTSMQLQAKRYTAPAITNNIPLELQQSLFRLERKLYKLYGQTRSTMKQRDMFKSLPAVFVTGASENFFSRLENLIGSVHFWSPTRNILVFDLGLNAEQLIQLQSMDRVLVWDGKQRDNLQNYAWKSSCIARAVEEYGKVLWVDAGGDIRGKLESIDSILQREDNFYVQGQDMDMSPWSHPTTLDFFDTTKQFVKDKYSFSGNCQGYVLDSKAYWEVLKVTEACSRYQECIAPQGSSLANHRYDQIAMSSAIYTDEEMNRAVTPHTEFLAAVRPQLPQDHRIASTMVVHTKRGDSSTEYTRYVKRQGKRFDARTVKEMLVV